MTVGEKKPELTVTPTDKSHAYRKPQKNRNDLTVPDFPHNALHLFPKNIPQGEQDVCISQTQIRQGEVDVHCESALDSVKVEPKPRIDPPQLPWCPGDDGILIAGDVQSCDQDRTEYGDPA